MFWLRQIKKHLYDSGDLIYVSKPRMELVAYPHIYSVNALSLNTTRWGVGNRTCFHLIIPTCWCIQPLKHLQKYI